MISGFKNENLLVLALNNKHYCDLNINLKNVINYSFKNKDGVIKCIKRAGQNKSDLIINIDKETHSYSIKKGSGNSVHQEPVGSFISFLEKEYDLPGNIKKNLLFFIWGDGTMDGSGDKDKRINARKFKNKHPKKIKEIQEYFNSIKKNLIKRFLVDGAVSSTPNDFFYYGNVDSGICCLANHVLNWVESNSSNGVIHVGRLSFQAWNRNINGGILSEHKRGVIQLKWGTIENDLKIIKDEQGN